MITAEKVQTVNVLGIDVFKITMPEVLNVCEDHIVHREKLLVGVVNVAKAVNSRKDAKLHKSLDDANIVVADGIGIVWLSKLMGNALPERITGIDLMYKLLEKANEEKHSVYFLGATKEVVEKVVDHTKHNYPKLTVAGYRDGYFGEDDESEVAENIKQSRTDILFVAIPSPKKENFLSKWQSYMEVPICHGVGGSFDIVAKITRRAPIWMQEHGLEWFYRFSQEPRRLWKRYFVTNSIFMLLSIFEIARSRINNVIAKIH